MGSTRVKRSSDKVHLSLLVGSYLIERFDVQRIYPNKTKTKAIRLLILIGLSIWSLASMLKFILEYIEYLDTEEGDSSLRDYSNYYSSSVWPYV